MANMVTSSSTEVSAHSTFSPINEVRAVIQPEGLVLLHISNGMFYQANQVGARIWAKLTAGIRLDEVTKQIAGEFDVPETTVAADAFEFVNSLLAQGFLKLEARR